MKVTDFTPAEAQALVRLAESAPLQNMTHATAVRQLLEKFVQWYALTQEPAVAPKRRSKSEPTE